MRMNARMQSLRRWLLQLDSSKCWDKHLREQYCVDYCGWLGVIMVAWVARLARSMAGLGWRNSTACFSWLMAKLLFQLHGPACLPL